MSAVAGAVTAAAGQAVTGDWLAVDTTAAQRGYGPARTPGPGGNAGTPVPMPASPLAVESPEYAPDADEVVYSSGGAGPWPRLPDAGTAADQPAQRPSGTEHQGVMAATVPQSRGGGWWAGTEDLQTWDAVAQATDTHGWAQNIPNDRVSARRTSGQANPLNNPAWYGYGENPVLGHLAVRGVALTADPGAPGTPGIGQGALPDWAMTGGQGSTAYETPAPPQTTPAPQESGSESYQGAWL
jgi:hypothetical protein